ncbi:MAG: AAA family ATPase [Rhodobacteraceae bacterium]|nr:AAA family ATPase [Paracoccaceae bacterium]
MRYIDRSAIYEPKFLSSKDMDFARNELSEFLELTTKGGQTRRVPDDFVLRNNPDAQEEMAELFGHVCAYCESPALPSQKGGSRRGSITQHRPSSNARNQDGSSDFISYAWLTYDWENLFWVCPECARRKENYFYVARRASVGAPVAECREVEDALMLDPSEMHPWEHLDFRLDGGVFPMEGSLRGETTIGWLALNRGKLARDRRRVIENVLRAIWRDGGTGGLVGTMSGSNPAAETFFLLDADNHTEPGDEIWPPTTYMGAATIAILRSRLGQSVDATSPSDFLERFSALPEVQRNHVVERALDEALGQSATSSAEPAMKATPSSKPSAPKFRRPSRTPSIKKMPLYSDRLQSVSISNFKALKGIEFTLPEAVDDIEQVPCMLLLGENATGKSSVLEAMTLALIGTREAAELDDMLAEEELAPRDLIHWSDASDPTQTEEFMGVSLGFLEAEEPVDITAHRSADSFEGAAEPSKIILAYGPRRFFKKSGRRFRAPAYRVRSLFDPMAMIANPIDWLTSLKPQDFDAAARALREVLMLAKEDDFERELESDGGGRIFITANGERTALKDMSVGYKSVIAMVCDIIRELLYQYDNLEFAHAVVFIDEIETHLHPRWKMQIMQLLRRAFPKVQFVVTTHDPLCLRGMYNGEVFVLRRDAFDAKVEKVDDLPSIRGMRAEQILTSEFFGLGSTDPETDAKLMRFNQLVAKTEPLSESEEKDRDRLHDELQDNMVLGSTIAEQAYARALQKEVKRTQVTPSRGPAPSRVDYEEEFSSLYRRRR